MPPTLTEDWAAALDAVVDELLQRACVEAPPVDALCVARRLGFVVAWDNQQSGRARRVRPALRRPDGPHEVILLRRDARRERHQWAIAHELGEHFAAEGFRRLDLDPQGCSPRLREDWANAFAMRLLLPTRWVRPAAAGCRWDLLQLKATFATASHELIARRMLDVPQPLVITIFDQGRLTYRWSNQHPYPPRLLPLERGCWMAAHSDGQPSQQRAGPYLVRCWPVHEPGWVREILRTEWFDDASADEFA
jgi:hypothetical protein